MPHAKNGYSLSINFVDNDVRLDRDKLTSRLPSRNGIFFGDVANNTDDVRLHRGPPDDAHSNRAFGGSAATLPAEISNSQLYTSS
jgi:hypothetical protein